MSEWIQTFTGKRFDLENIESNIIDIRDIAKALSNICRFTGQVTNFYSVAQHCDLCAKVALEEYHNTDLARLALLHDATEAYIGDVSRPLKKLLKSTYGPLEERIHNHIYKQFNLIEISKKYNSQLKEIDSRMLFTERIDLFNNNLDGWTDVKEPYNFRVVPTSPHVAEQYFLGTYDMLFTNRDI